jgi:hypothetical protein
MSYEQHAEQAMDFLSDVDLPRRVIADVTANKIACAQVHATLALAEAIRQVASAIASRR